MQINSYWAFLILAVAGLCACSKRQFAYKPTFLSPPPIEGYKLVWNDEFNFDGKPDAASWDYEKGFVRNEELQWYQPENANTTKGVLVIEGKREDVKIPFYKASASDWKQNREFAHYTAASINTRGKREFKYGIIEVRARIDTAMGMWPAIWTLGVNQRWPANGEIDLMEYYRVEGKPAILANAAWADERMQAVWDSKSIPFSHFMEKDADWPKKFHVWKMDWTEASIKLYLDDQLLNEIDVTKTLNADGFNPFQQPHYILLNLAIGRNGGDPSGTTFPKKYEVDYVRVYQKK